jgi:hypothetical protein
MIEVGFLKIGAGSSKVYKTQKHIGIVNVNWLHE